jgi:hypothetical protein
VWQEVRSELHPQGLEVVTVALDAGGAEAAGPWIDRARPDHPALIDETHLLDRLLGILNVPSGVWIDEEGVIVRPPETAFPGKVTLPDVAPEPSAELGEVIEETMKIRVSPKRYLAGLRDWVQNGAASVFALDPDEVVSRSKPVSFESSQAAAHFELAQHLHRSGQDEAAVQHFAEARRLEPSNWTYKRQAWSLADPVLQVKTGPYEGDWLSDIRELGAESYYAPLDMPRLD